VIAVPSVLRPPNHKLRPVSIDAVASDLCDPHPAVACTVSSNELPERRRRDNDGKHDRDGDDDADQDIVRKNGSLFLRAEPGLVYTITCKATDASGNSTVKTTTVTVQHREKDEQEDER
jgi:hypothetical protein